MYVVAGTSVLLIWLNVWVTGQAPTDESQDKNVTEEFVARYLDPARYHKFVRPGKSTGEPTVVHADLYISSISDLDELNMDFTVTMFFRQRWHDERLAFKDIHNEMMTLNYNLFDRLWVPDLQFDNLKQGHFKDITVPNRLINVYPNGDVYYSQGLTLKLECDMDLLKFPMDVQTCNIQFSSFSNTDRHIITKWANISQPIQRPPKLFLAEFDFVKAEPKRCDLKFITGTFSCAYAELTFKRKLNYFLIQVYVPSCLIVILSWVSFWIDADAVPARVSIGLLTVLTMTTYLTGTASTQPRVSYVKALDVWLTMCMVFVFTSFLQYSVVNVLYRRENRGVSWFQEKRRYRPGRPDENGTCSIYMNNYYEAHPSLQPPRRPARLPDERMCPSPKCLVWSHKRYKGRKSVYVDALSKYLFPSAFLLFGTLYWIVYTVII